MSYNNGSALPPKDSGLALVFAIVGLLGINGLQYFYLGKIGKGVIFLLTLGFLYIGTIISLFTIMSETKQINTQRAVGIS